jgi:hypothetical protein
VVGKSTFLSPKAFTLLLKYHACCAAPCWWKEEGGNKQGKKPDFTAEKTILVGTIIVSLLKASTEELKRGYIALPCVALLGGQM